MVLQGSARSGDKTPMSCPRGEQKWGLGSLQGCQPESARCASGHTAPAPGLWRRGRIGCIPPAAPVGWECCRGILGTSLALGMPSPKAAGQEMSQGRLTEEQSSGPKAKHRLVPAAGSPAAGLASTHVLSLSPKLLWLGALLELDTTRCCFACLGTGGPKLKEDPTLRSCSSRAGLQWCGQGHGMGSSGHRAVPGAPVGLYQGATSQSTLLWGCRDAQKGRIM